MFGTNSCTTSRIERHTNTASFLFERRAAVPLSVRSGLLTSRAGLVNLRPLSGSCVGSSNQLARQAPKQSPPRTRGWIGAGSRSAPFASFTPIIDLPSALPRSSDMRLLAKPSISVRARLCSSAGNPVPETRPFFGRGGWVGAGDAGRRSRQASRAGRSSVAEF